MGRPKAARNKDKTATAAQFDVVPTDISVDADADVNAILAEAPLAIEADNEFVDDLSQDGAVGRLMEEMKKAHGWSTRELLLRQRVGPSTMKTYDREWRLFVAQIFKFAKIKFDKNKSDAWVGLLKDFLVKEGNYEKLVAWTSDYCAGVARKTDRGGGRSQLDNASAACSHFLIPAGLLNPFHHAAVKCTRQSLARITSQIDEVKSKAEAPSPMEATELSAAACAKAVKAFGSEGIYGALRWVQLAAMMVLIRFLSCRYCTLSDIRLWHVVSVDDSDSPIAAAYRIFLPKHKGDPLGSNGGAAMRAYPQRFNVYLCPVFFLSLWLLIARPFIVDALADELARLHKEADDKATSTGKPSRAKTDADLLPSALRNMYLFPHVTPKGLLVWSKPMEHAAATANLATVRDAAGFGGRGFTWHGIGRGSLFFIASSVGMSPLEIQAWGRWFATADQNGYMKNDEAFLARLSRQQAYLPVPPRGTPKLVRAWKLKGDVSRCIPAYSDRVARLFRFAEHVVHLATGQCFPSELAAQFAFIAAHLPAIARDPTADPDTSPAVDDDEVDTFGAYGGRGVGGREELAPVTFDAAREIAGVGVDLPVAAAAWRHNAAPEEHRGTTPFPDATRAFAPAGETAATGTIDAAVAAPGTAATSPHAVGDTLPLPRATVPGTLLRTSPAAASVNQFLAVQLAVLSRQLQIALELLRSSALANYQSRTAFVATWAKLDRGAQELGPPELLAIHADAAAGKTTELTLVSRKAARAVESLASQTAPRRTVAAHTAAVIATRSKFPLGLSPKDAFALGEGTLVDNDGNKYPALDSYHDKSPYWQPGAPAELRSKYKGVHHAIKHELESAPAGTSIETILEGLHRSAKSLGGPATCPNTAKGFYDGVLSVLRRRALQPGDRSPESVQPQAHTRDQSPVAHAGSKRRLNASDAAGTGATTAVQVDDARAPAATDTAGAGALAMPAAAAARVDMSAPA